MDDKIVEFESQYREKRGDESLSEYYIDIRGDISPTNMRNNSAAWGHLQQYLDRNSLGLDELNVEHTKSFVQFLRGKDAFSTDGGIANTIGSLSAMFSWLNKEGLVSGNPFKKMNRRAELDTETPAKLKVPIDDLCQAIMDISHPLKLTIVVVLLHTGLRISELSNLDERDINLNHSISSVLDDPRPELSQKPDSIYVDSRISKDDEVNGEVRTCSNKPKSTRVIPLTTEAKETLVWYLSMRPIPGSEANPIFTQGDGKGYGGIIGKRPGTQKLRNVFVEWSDSHGWYDKDKSSTVKPHWCRHWFTTQLRSNLDEEKIEVGNEDDFIDALRGDTSSDTKSQYIQMSWGKDGWMREAVDDSLPSLLKD